MMVYPWLALRTFFLYVLFTNSIFIADWLKFQEKRHDKGYCERVRKPEENKEFFGNKVLEWYDRNRRTFPWRALPGEKPNTYHVWLSEVMLQQTGVVTVIPYFRNFTQKWPTVNDLALASEQDVLSVWAGLGYYSRARNLQRCAQMIVAEYGGDVPQTLEELKKLPGIGDYTANAILAIAFDKSANVVDGNVERVMARLTAFDTPFPSGKKAIRTVVESFVPMGRYGDYAQGLMDLGSLICTPKSPKCDVCPVQSLCKAYRTGRAEGYPKRAAKAKNPTIAMTAFVLTRKRDGAVLMQYRDKKGMLGGMLEVPSTPWGIGERGKTVDNPFAYAPLMDGDWQECPVRVHHVFSHFALNVTIYKASCDGMKLAGTTRQWITPENFAKMPIPTLTHKILTGVVNSERQKEA